MIGQTQDYRPTIYVGHYHDDDKVTTQEGCLTCQSASTKNLVPGTQENKARSPEYPPYEDMMTQIQQNKLRQHRT